MTKKDLLIEYASLLTRMMDLELFEESKPLIERIAAGVNEADKTVIYTTPVHGERHDVTDLFTWVYYEAKDVVTSQKIATIKALRGRTGIGLKEAKDFVEDIIDKIRRERAE